MAQHSANVALTSRICWEFHVCCLFVVLRVFCRMASIFSHDSGNIYRVIYATFKNIGENQQNVAPDNKYDFALYSHVFFVFWNYQTLNLQPQRQSISAANGGAHGVGMAESLVNQPQYHGIIKTSCIWLCRY